MDEQRYAALALANEMRGQRSALKRGIADGTVSVRALLRQRSILATDLV